MSAAKSRIGLHISTLIVMTACLSVVIAAILVGQNLKKVLTLWGDDIQMTVYLSQDLSTESRQQLETEFSQNQNIGKVSFVSQENALSAFRGQLANYAPDILHDNDLLHLIPASFQLSLKSAIPVNQQLNILNELASVIKQKPGVDEVSYGQDWVQKYASFVMAFENIFIILGAVIFAASILVISNAIRSSIFARRDEIEVLELIGATPWMIRKPYFIEGAMIGLVSAMGGLAVCFFIYQSALNILKTEIGFLQLTNHLRFLNPAEMAVMLLAGIVLGSIGAYFSVRSLNDGWAASS